MDALLDTLLDTLISYLNCGLYLSLALGVLILLRPVISRLLTPGQRVFLWGVMWLVGFMPGWMQMLGWIPLPLSLRQLVTPRTLGFDNISAFLPEIGEAGTYFLALPGGGAVPFSVPQWLADGRYVLFPLYLAVVLFLAFLQDTRVRRLTRKGRALDPAGYEAIGARPEEKLRVKVCPALPTSFVVRHLGYHEVFLQQELPPEQMKLVLLHEREHARRHHPWLQGLATTTWAFHFWSPLVWLAYCLFRRDMELACDQGVLDQLDDKGRREYARTLVELASDRPVWGGLTSFGECDAAVRVKRAAAWRWAPRGWRWVFQWVAAIALALFLVAGAPTDRVLPEDILLEMDRMEIWEEAAQQADWGPDTVFYVKGDNSFGDVRFQDVEGNWWQIFYRRAPNARFGREVYVEESRYPPDLEDYQVLPLGER